MLAACGTTPPRISIRRVEVNGDNAKYVGELLLSSLQARGARISESRETAPVLKGTSEIKKFENGVQVFTIEITDSSSLKVKMTVSTQDLSPLNRDLFIQKGVGQAADAVIRELGPKQPQQPAPAEQKPEHFSSS